MANTTAALIPTILSLLLTQSTRVDANHCSRTFRPYNFPPTTWQSRRLQTDIAYQMLLYHILTLVLRLD